MVFTSDRESSCGVGDEILVGNLRVVSNEIGEWWKTTIERSREKNIGEPKLACIDRGGWKPPLRETQDITGSRR
jgi:hypothetical protein